MKLTLSGQIVRLQGRVQKSVTQSLRKIRKFAKTAAGRDARRFLLLVVAMWLIIPVLTVSAADTQPVQSTDQVAGLVLDQNLDVTQSKFDVVVRQSPHDLVKQSVKPVVKTVLAAAATTETSDPGVDVKRQLVQKAAGAWNIDWKVLEAVWQIETGKTWYTSRGSSAGAIGPCQFMPGTWRAYAQDGNGDGVKNVYDARDCLYASAQLLAVNGAAEGNIEGALLHYNHSLVYVNQVKGIIASIGN